MSTIQPRKIRSFVRRPGRITKAQTRALESLWPRWGVDFAERGLDLDSTFGRSAKRVLDIGFGDGEALLTSAAHNPDVDYLGVEVHEPGIGHLLVLLERSDVRNIRIIRRDVVDVIEHMLPERSFDVVNVFFPDPWPKKRHHKRRLIQAPFVDSLERLLRPGGFVHLATDCAEYADRIRDVFAAAAGFEEPADLAAVPTAFRPPTKFERRGQMLGNEASDLFYARR